MLVALVRLSILSFILIVDIVKMMVAGTSQKNGHAASLV